MWSPKHRRYSYWFPTRVFVTLFIGQGSVYTATCFVALVRVAATSCEHMSPRTVVLVSPVTFAQSYLHKPQFQLPQGAPPPTTVEDRVCRGADVPWRRLLPLGWMPGAE